MRPYLKKTGSGFVYVEESAPQEQRDLCTLLIHDRPSTWQSRGQVCNYLAWVTRFHSKKAFLLLFIEG